ncbi:unnamed protein product [Calypogeia fissa]
MSKTSVEQRSEASKDGDAENATKTVNVIIKGKVQGVYYRNWTVDSAQQLDVNGWVRNLKDGSVEAVFSGKSANVDSLIQKCYQGPCAARVSNVEVSPWKDEVLQGFERKPTIW